MLRFSLWVWGHLPDKETEDPDGSLLGIPCAHLVSCLNAKIRAIFQSLKSTRKIYYLEVE